jgi:hypothetical protein
MQKPEGKAMAELVKGNKLERMDVLVTRSKGSLLGWLIRFGTKSYWNHALMVYVVRDHNQGYETTFIIESGGAGIDIHNIAHYFEKSKQYDVGIKRWEPDWLKNESPGKDRLRYSRRIRGFALGEIDDSYNHRLILEIGGKILRQLILTAISPWQRTKPPEKRAIRLPHFMRRLSVNAYICSGFVQWAYYQSLSRILQEEGGDKSRLQDVLFNPRLTGEFTKDDLLATTPADIANSDKLKWKYIVKNGDVFPVSSQEEVNLILEPAKKSKKKE